MGAVLQTALQRDAARAEQRFRARHRAALEQKTHRLPPSMARHVLGQWDSLYPVSSSSLPGRQMTAANVAARQLLDDFGSARTRAAYDESLIRDRAENYATLCSRMGSLESRRSFGLHFGIEPPKARGLTPAGETLRWDCPQWWRRQLRRVWTRQAENAMRAAGLIRKGRQPYASNEAVDHRAAMARRTEQWARDHVMVSEDGEQLELLELRKHSIADPAIRRTELMVRARGFDETAQALGHECDFWTLTTPSAFHAQHSAGGVNEAWQKADRPRVRAAQQWLCRMWARARAHIRRCSLQVYGIRTAEPHHDGTPHWHLQLFGEEHALAIARVIIRGVWLSEYATEKGAAEFRTKVERIDRAKGSPVGYIAKYISKNIDGHGAAGDMESDETGGTTRDACERVLAWARVHGIRQFQQIGGAPVGKWRELRRLREEVAPDDIEAARAAADRHSWAEYTRLAGTLHFVRETVRDGITVRPACSVNRYGEPQQPRIVGLRDWCGEVITRPHRWQIQRKPTEHGQQGATGKHVTAAANGTCKAEPNPRSRDRLRGSHSAPRSGAPNLGPVAITVRDDVGPASGDPVGWTARETSMAGPLQ